MGDLEQSHEHSWKQFNFLCREEYFAVSHHIVSEAPVVTEFKTQARLVAEKLPNGRLKRRKCELTKHCTFLYAFSSFFWLLT